MCTLDTTLRLVVSSGHRATLLGFPLQDGLARLTQLKFPGYVIRLKGLDQRHTAESLTIIRLKVSISSLVFNTVLCIQNRLMRAVSIRDVKNFGPVNFKLSLYLTKLYSLDLMQSAIHIEQ